MMSDFSARVRAGVLWRSGGQLAAQLVFWASTLIVIRLLDPADYGLVALAAVVTGFLTLLAGQGFTAALIQAPDLPRVDARRFMMLLIAINLGLAAVQLLAAPAAAAYFREPRVADLLRVQALGYLLIPFAAVPAALAARELDFRTQTIVEWAGGFAGALTALAMAAAGFGVWALIGGQLMPLAVRAAMYAFGRYALLPLPGIGRILPLARFGSAMTLNGVVWFLYSQADVVIGGRRLDADQIGLYATAFFLAALPITKLIPILNEVGFSAYSRVASDPDAVRAGFLKVVRLTSVLLFPVFLGLAATAPLLVPVLLGAKWAGSATPALFLALAMPLYALANLFGPAVNALGRPRVQLGNALFGLAIMPAAFWVGAGEGPVGLAAAWTIAYPLLFGISAVRSLGVIGVPVIGLARAAGPPFLAAAAMAGIVHLVVRALGDAGWAPLVGVVALGVAVYAMILRFALRARLAEALAMVRR